MTEGMLLCMQQKDATSDAGLDPENDAGPKGTGGVAAGAMPEMPPEAQPNSSEPPFQRPPMWHPQVFWPSCRCPLQCFRTEILDSHLRLRHVCSGSVD